MKKFLPIILFLLGLIVVIAAFFIVRGRRQETTSDEDETALIEVPLEKRPVVSLTPTADGHYLKLKIEKIMIDGAVSLDYELLYKLPNGLTQGVPGMVDLDGEDSIETELLLGSESSGKFRYDEGVEEGTLTLKFRNDKGKLLVKFSAAFHLQTGVDELGSLDGEFSYEFSGEEKGFFVVMETFGIPGQLDKMLEKGPYGIFSSKDEIITGKVNFDSGGEIFRYDGEEWVRLENSESEKLGIFVSVTE